MDWVQLATARTLTAYMTVRPSSAGTFTVNAPSGAVQQSATAATLDSVDTTLSGAAVAGASTLSLTSASGVAVGTRYLVGGSEDVGGEFVLVAGLSGTTATLARRLQRAHAAGAAFQGTRASFAVGASAVGSVGRGWRIEYTATGLPSVYVHPFDVTRFAPVSGLTVDGLRSREPQVLAAVSSGAWLPEVIEQTWQMVLRRIAQKASPGGFVGIVDLTEAHAYLARATILETAGEEHAPRRDDYRQRFQEEFEAALAAAAYDANGDGAARTGAGWYRGVRLVRS